MTVIANGQNVDDSNSIVIIMRESGDTDMLNLGLTSSGQFGVNVNTSRIKDVATTVGVNYKYSDTDSGNKTLRTTYQDDGNLDTATENTGKKYANSVGANMEFEKEEGKVWFHIRPAFSYSDIITYSNGKSETSREGVLLNSSQNDSRSQSQSKSADFDADITFRELGGKAKRSLQLEAYSTFANSIGGSDETSVLTMAGGVDSRNMHYDSDRNSTRLDGSILYTEPIGEKWSLSPMASITWSKSGRTKDAFDVMGKNDYYSSVNSTDYIEQQYGLKAQYDFDKGCWVTIGGRVMGVLNETYSKSYGVEEVTGKGEWNWFLTPNIRFQYTKGSDRFSISATGYSRRPGAANMLPVLNITNPASLSLGNIYLKPYTQTSISGNWNRNNREKFSTLMVYLFGQVNSNPLSYASWYDKDGILYSVPVNARKPGASASLMVNYTTPLDAKKNWSLTLVGYGAMSSSVSYQSGTILPGINKDSFDYSTFMADFWGKSSGDRFYGGLSGFEESQTMSFSPRASVRVKYNQERYSIIFSTVTNAYVARYSLDPSINMNTLDTRIGMEGSYITKHEFEFNSELYYAFYNGYAEGYGQPEWQWNADISKNIGAFNLSITVHDILNQTRNLAHTVTANYQEDSYRLIMGRYVLFGVKWNFGKMNAAHSQRAQMAAWNMAF